MRILSSRWSRSPIKEPWWGRRRHEDKCIRMWLYWLITTAKCRSTNYILRFSHLQKNWNPWVKIHIKSFQNYSFRSWFYLKLANTMSLGVAQLINATAAFRKYMLMQFLSLSLSYIHKANQEDNFGFNFALMASSSDQEGNCSKWKRLQFLTLLTKHWPGSHPIYGYSIHDKEYAYSSFRELNFWNAKYYHNHQSDKW